MPPHHEFASERIQPLDALEQAAFRDLAMALRAASWDVALAVVDTAVERELIPSLNALGTIRRLANLPAFIGGLAASIARPHPGRRRGTNPILARLARDHVIERERVGFSAREIVQEFLLLRRVMWRFVQDNIDPTLDARAVLRLEDLLNSILDEVITECTVIYFDRATQELSERSRRDSLTGLLNHQAFNNRLDEEIDRARRYGGDLQVIYFDLDDFKNINDEQGHHEGDRALVGLARLVLESIRDSDFAGRIGGDEFVIGLVESSEVAAHLLLDRLRARLAEAVRDGAVPVGTGISAGCACFPTEADCAQDLLVLADRRLYDDKRARKTAAVVPGPPTLLHRDRGDGELPTVEDDLEPIELVDLDALLDMTVTAPISLLQGPFATDATEAAHEHEHENAHAHVHEPGREPAPEPEHEHDQELAIDPAPAAADDPLPRMTVFATRIVDASDETVPPIPVAPTAFTTVPAAKPRTAGGPLARLAEPLPEPAPTDAAGYVRAARGAIDEARRRSQHGSPGPDGGPAPADRA